MSTEQIKNILDQMEHDHKEVKTLMEEIVEANSGRLAKFKKMKEALVSHARAEEKTIYSVLDKINTDKGQTQVNEAYAEHRVVDKLIQDLESIGEDHGEWLARFKTIRENVTHHADEEEEHLFPLARKLLTEGQLEQLLRLFNDAKASLKESLPTQAQISARKMSREVERALHL